MAVAPGRPWQLLPGTWEGEQAAGDLPSADLDLGQRGHSQQDVWQERQNKVEGKEAIS